MYKEYFGLNDLPFSIAPNPQYLYMSERHREALAHLLYGIKSDGGFLLLTGEVGTGKTTLCRCLLEQIPEDVDTAYVLNPKMTAAEMLATICDELHIEYPEHASIKILVDKLNAFLLGSHQSGRRTVVIIDEAQNLSVDVLEQLRLLTNLETNQRKLIQIVLLGQPELLTLLAKPELRQLAQRVTARFHLDALNRAEVEQYIQHRLNIAGAKGQLFPANVVKQIFKITRGIPRLINLVCDRALLGTYTQNLSQVNSATLKHAASEILGATPPPSPSRFGWMQTSIVILVIVVLGLVYQNFAGLIPQTKTTLVQAAQNNPRDNRAQPDPVDAATVGSSRPSKVFMKENSHALNTAISRLSELQGMNSRLNAFTALFKLWGIDIIMFPGSSPCALAKASGFSCLAKTASLTELTHINRPSLVTLNTAPGDKVYFIITHIDAQQVTLLGSQGAYRIERKTFDTAWDGEFIALWRIPPAFKKASSIGDRGATVDWLASQMALLDDSGIQPKLGAQFDIKLETRVKQFQISVGLPASGIAGPETWIHINNIEAIDIPFITRNGT